MLQLSPKKLDLFLQLEIPYMKTQEQPSGVRHQHGFLLFVFRKSRMRQARTRDQRPDGFSTNQERPGKYGCETGIEHTAVTGKFTGDDISNKYRFPGAQRLLNQRFT